MQLPSAIVCTPSATNNVLPLPAQASEHIVDAVDRSDAVQSRADAQSKIGSNCLSCFLFLWFDYDLYISDDSYHTVDKRWHPNTCVDIQKHAPHDSNQAHSATYVFY